MANLLKAIQLATSAHGYQKDKGGKPYILHPLRVMLQMKTDEEMAAAVLHDVVEDTEYTLSELELWGFDEEVILAVDHLTRRQNERYQDYIERVAGNALARKVKLADIQDNLSPARFEAIKNMGFEKRYIEAREYLEGIENDEKQAREEAASRSS